MCAAAVEHAHNSTAFTNAVVIHEGREATSHGRVELPRDGEVHVKWLQDCVSRPGFDGKLHTFWVQRNVDYVLLIKLEIVPHLRMTRSYVVASILIL